MSLRVITIVWDRFPHGGSKLLAMLALADWCNDEGRRLYPSKAALAAKIRMSERQATRLIQWLEEKDWLEIEHAGGRGRGQTNRYRIKLETLTNCPVIRPAEPVDNSELRVTNCSVRVTPVSSKGDIAMSYEPLEPLYNRKEPEPVLAQRAFLKSLLEMPNPAPTLIAEAEKNLEELLALHCPQGDMLENGTDND